MTSHCTARKRAHVAAPQGVSHACGAGVQGGCTGGGIGVGGGVGGVGGECRQHPSQLQARVRTKSRHAYGEKSPQVAPAHGRAQAWGGGAGGAGMVDGLGAGGGGRQQSSQSHDNGGRATTWHGVPTKRSHVPVPQRLPHDAGSGSLGGSGARGAGEGGTGSYEG